MALHNNMYSSCAEFPRDAMQDNFCCFIPRQVIEQTVILLLPTLVDNLKQKRAGTDDILTSNIGFCTKRNRTTG